LEDPEIENELQRAEDILLGSYGFGEGAKIVSVVPVFRNGLQKDAIGYEVVGEWSDGERFSYSSDGQIDQLEQWALRVFNAKKHRKA
jgi:hypothetical protein